MSKRSVIGIDEAGRRSGRASPRYHKYLIGIDEAGRGPLAGPVVVAGIVIKIKDKRQKIKVLCGIKDSKKLSAKQREKWFEILTNHPQIEWAVSKIHPKVIDRINIARATDLGARRVYKNLCGDDKTFAFLDGGLKLPGNIPYVAVIKGDEKIPAVSAASVIAKVTRDRAMLRLHKKFPQYRFDLHKGYGTKFHYEMIRKFGPSGAHRKSFRLV